MQYRKGNKHSNKPIKFIGDKVMAIKTKTELYITSIKDRVIARNKQQNKVYELIIKAYETMIPIIEKFDNKQCNVKITRAICEEISDSFYLSKVSNNRVEFGFNGNERLITLNEKFIGYVDNTSDRFDIVTNENNKVIASETIKVINRNIGYIKTWIEKYDYMINNYDKIIEASEKFEKAFNEYIEVVPTELLLTNSYLTNNFRL